MARRRSLTARRALSSALCGVALLTTACRSPHETRQPTIEFAQLPPSEARGGPDHLDSISGQVVNGRPGAQIVLYARSEGDWWVQPFRNRAFTKLDSNGKWDTVTHRGSDYAALLVTTGFQPGARVPELPSPGGSILAVAISKGSSGSLTDSPTLHFSGYDWKVRSGGGDSGGDLCDYEASNAWVDDQGYLHLAMGQAGGRWHCAGINLPRNLGYGTYRFVVADSTHLPPWAILALLLRSATEDPDERTGFSIQLGGWGQTEGKNASCVLQPYYIPGNTVRYTVPVGPITYTLRWNPGTAEFRTFAGASSTAGLEVMAHEFRSGVAVPGAETVHLDLHNYRHGQSGLHHPVEIVVRNFEYLP